MPTLYLSPSTQEWNLYVNGHGSEEHFMNQLADAMEPYLYSCGIRFTRNTPDMTAASSIREANAGEYDFYLALHSNASPEASYGQNRGVIAFYYPGSTGGERAAGLFVNNLRPLYPLPDKVYTKTSTSIGEVRLPRFPAVLLEIGFHDNIEDASWIEANIEALAPAIVRALTEYFYIPFVWPMPPQSATVRTLSGNLLLRAYPSMDAAVLTAMPNGAALTVYGAWQGWYVVHYYDWIGYASAAYVELG